MLITYTSWLPSDHSIRCWSLAQRHSRLLSRLALQIEYLLNTGNLVSNNTLDLSQNTGFTVVAEKLNFFRYAAA